MGRALQIMLKHVKPVKVMEHCDGGELLKAILSVC